MKTTLFCLAGLLLLPAGDKDQLRNALGDNALAGTWIYDDLEAGVAEAARSRKPLLVVLRCVP